MKVDLDIVTGFLGSGKTSLINRLLPSPSQSQKSILILQFEEGEEKIHQRKGIPVVSISPKKGLTAEDFLSVLHRYHPQQIILEYNGLFQLEDLLQLLEKNPLRKQIRPNKIYATVMGDTFDTYSQNLGTIFTTPLNLANTIILITTEDLPPSKVKEISNQLRRINHNAVIKTTKDITEEKEGFLQGGFRLGPFLEKGSSFLLLYGSILFLFFLLRIIGLGGLVQEEYHRLFAFTTIFISILLQAFPFILIGVMVSALIQVLVPSDFIGSLFSRNAFISMVAALFAGVFFPICDCAIIPVMRGLLQKGVPLPVAITFMLAAPIVDPVVIISTFVAFPNQPMVAVSRFLLGISIALLTGLLFFLVPYKNPLLRTGGIISNCTCQYCTDNSRENDQGFLPRLKGVFVHAGGEFFHIGQFLILAAAFSALIQTCLPQQILSLFTAHPAGALLTMMAFAFLLSICSTSDAFIARNFYGLFALGPITGFMVFGAMLDIKNLFLLLGNFDRSLVIRLVFSILILSFLVLFLFTLRTGGTG